MDESLKSNLTCPICLDLYNDPVALYCMHSFCRQCLLETVRNRAPSRTSDDTRIRVPCPNCKREFPLSKDGVRGMQRNFQLQSIVEGYKRNQLNPSSSEGDMRGPPCDMCKEKECRAAIKRCTKCEVSYCDTCLEVFHPPRGIFATHKVTNIGVTGAATGGGARPPIPAPKPQSMTVAPIKAQFRQDLQDLTKEADGIRRFVEDIKQAKSALEKNTADLKKDINNECCKLRDYISKTETEQRGVVVDESKQKMMMLEMQLREHQECLRKQDDVIDSLRALLKEPDDQLFLKTATSMKEKMKNRKENQPQLITVPSNADLNQCTQMFQDFKQRDSYFCMEMLVENPR
ncbi:probable E3 ubiquitin-protein ligase MID2 [Amphiura filiformis]|uniref:probable E3 ubiquitin-protein ligase MID2 n=1 Tax=Amphiura filiformis TaxID=82378 RepID=UPI003B20FED6